ncbi:MAG: MFS transporter [Pseudonocardiaceae bacterium]
METASARGDAGHQASYREAFALGEFRALWGAEALSQVGDQLARVALAVLVYRDTESAALAGLTYALTMAPSLLGGVFLSGLADRYGRRGVMVTSDLLRAALIGLVALPGLPFPVLCVLVGLVSFLQAPFKAAQLALLPDVLSGDLYVAGMGIRTITVQTAQMLGFAGGGFLLALIGPSGALLVDAATFVVSALLVRAGVRPRVAPRSSSEGSAALTSLGTSAAAGARLVWGDTGLRTLVGLSWLSAMLIVYEGLAAPYAAELGAGAAAVGLILASDPAGSVVGAYLVTRRVSPHRRTKLIGALGIASCLPLLGCLAQPGLVMSLVLFAVAGALGTALLVLATTTFSLAVPEHSRAQALGLKQSGQTTVQGLTPLLAGIGADTVGTAHTVGLVGVLGLIVALPAAVTWRRVTAARAGVRLAPPQE